MKTVCPKCNSDQLTANKKGFSAGKAIGGAVLTGGIGLLAGFHGSGKVMITCLACGYTFKAGEGKQVSDVPSAAIVPAVKQSVAGLENSVIYVLREKGFQPAIDYVVKEQGITAAEAKPFVDDVQRRFDVKVKENTPAQGTNSGAGVVVGAIFLLLFFLLFKACNS